jgi:hypothetical protein
MIIIVFRVLFLVRVLLVVQWNYLCAVYYDVKVMEKHFDGCHSIYRDIVSSLYTHSIFLFLSEWLRCLVNKLGSVELRINIFFVFSFLFVILLFLFCFCIKKSKINKYVYNRMITQF